MSSPLFHVDLPLRRKVGLIGAGLALRAGALILTIRAAGVHVRYKGDSSPVSEADEQAEAVILAGLAEHFPDIPVVAEEAAAAGNFPHAGDLFFLVDPLDGTKEFITGSDNFTVNIALIAQGEPVAGVVYAPALARMWIADGKAYLVDIDSSSELPPEKSWQPIAVRPLPEAGLVAMSSRNHAEARSQALLACLPVIGHAVCGSSLKFCRIAEGACDIYPRFGPTMEWDTAAGDAVLRAAGGAVINEFGERLVYGQSGKGFLNPGFVAVGDPALLPQVRERLKNLT